MAGSDMTSSARTVINAVASSGGAALRGWFTVASHLRPAAKPLHPRGRLMPATLTRSGATPGTGVAWLDEAGEDEVLVRESRAVGLPEPFPDIHGLALRVPYAADRSGDLLFATTGTGALTRYLLRPTRSPRRPQSTLLPYRTAGGALLLAAFPTAERGRFALACASPRGPWRQFAVLRIGERRISAEPDPMVAFDPMVNTLPGLAPYDWVRRLRAGAYAAARSSRS
jgi:hypothetical protein